MAIRAEQHAFRHFCSQSVKGEAEAAGADAETLLSRVEVVKFKGGHAAVVIAQVTAASSLRDERRFDAAAPGGYLLLTTELASVVAASFNCESVSPWR